MRMNGCHLTLDLYIVGSDIEQEQEELHEIAQLQEYDTSSDMPDYVRFDRAPCRVNSCQPGSKGIEQSG